MYSIYNIYNTTQELVFVQLYAVHQCVRQQDCINPFPAHMTSYDVHGEAFLTCQKDVMGHPARTPAVRACSWEVKFSRKKWMFLDNLTHLYGSLGKRLKPLHTFFGRERVKCILLIILYRNWWLCDCSMSAREAARCNQVYSIYNNSIMLHRNCWLCNCGLSVCEAAGLYCK